MKLIRTTFRNALRTPGFSLLYIGGVAFTIAFTLVYGFILYGQLGPVYPEYDRGSTYYLRQTVYSRPNMMMQSNIGQPFIDEFLRGEVKSVEDITSKVAFSFDYPMVQTGGKGPEFHVEVRNTDSNFGKFYKYEFLAGRYFSQQEMDAKERVAAISDKIAGRLFPSAQEAIGEVISIDHTKYRITGVFREGNALCSDSYGEVFIPYEKEIINDVNNVGWHCKYRGRLHVMMKVRPGMEDDLKRELREICQRISAVDTTAAKFFIPSIESHPEHTLTGWQSVKDDDKYLTAPYRSWLDLGKPFLIGLLVILIIPALNISGLIGARLDRMRADLGVQLCFGASRRRILGKILTENLVLTLAGGAIGLIAAWLIASFGGHMLLQLSAMDMFFDNKFGEDASIVTSEMAFAPLLFLLTLLVCLALNLLSAWIPASAALRRQTTELLNSKK